MVRGEEAAYQAFLRGQRAFDESDFDAALLAFGDALRLLPDERPYARSRGSIALWIARCHGQRYGLRADTADLDAEATVLQAYLARLGDIGKDAADREAKRALARQRLDEIAAERERIAGHGDAETQIDASLRGDYEGVKASSWAPSVADLAWYQRRDDPRQRSGQVDEHDPEPDRRVTPEPRRRKGTGLIAGGAVSLGLGVAALAVMGAGMARAHGAQDFSATQTPDERREQISRGLAGNAMTAAGAITGGVAVVLGAVLVGIGAKRRRADAPTLSLRPAVSRRLLGLALSVRF
ncbi:MAG: hypothetical protein U0168_29355 [Nannocystaceae bacterium]